MTHATAKPAQSINARILCCRGVSGVDGFSNGIPVLLNKSGRRVTKSRSKNFMLASPALPLRPRFQPSPRTRIDDPDVSIHLAVSRAAFCESDRSCTRPRTARESHGRIEMPSVRISDRDTTVQWITNSPSSASGTADFRFVIGGTSSAWRGGLVTQCR
jgi:hypothetical protein